jgi:hypothetical protein
MRASHVCGGERGVREQGHLVSAELEEMMVTRDATRDESQVGQGLGKGVEPNQTHVVQGRGCKGRANLWDKGYRYRGVIRYTF